MEKITVIYTLLAKAYETEANRLTEDSGKWRDLATRIDGLNSNLRTVDHTMHALQEEDDPALVVAEVTNAEYFFDQLTEHVVAMMKSTERQDKLALTSA
jgi:ribosomal protein L18E